MRIVIPDHIELPEAGKQKLVSLGATIYDDLPSDEAVIIERIKDAEIITANYIDMPSRVIDGAASLKYIVVPAVGYEWVDVAYAAQKGIRVLNCPTFNSQAVAEHAVALLMGVNRQLIAAASALKEGRWEHDPFVGVELQGKKLGLIGHGNIGKRIEKLVSGFDMGVAFVNSKASAQAVDDLVASSDVICVCAPLNDATRHLIDARRLALCKQDALLINVGRGAIIDQPALCRALETKAIRGAGLDVFEDEPLSGTPAEAIVNLARLPNVLATPHIAYNTRETARKLGEELLESIQSCISDQPINVVSP